MTPGRWPTRSRARRCVGDVFISANPSKDSASKARPTATGCRGTPRSPPRRWCWATTRTASSPQDLKTEPWYKVLAQPGILVGRTDPATDPKGVLAVTALNDAATTYSEPALKTLATESSDVFAENTLVGRLQAGQLDVGFFYGVEAAAATIPPFPDRRPRTLEAKYTVTVLNNAPHRPRPTPSSEYLLGPGGAAALAKDGHDVKKPPRSPGTPPAKPARGTFRRVTSRSARSPLTWLGGLLVVYLAIPVAAFFVRFSTSNQRGFNTPGLWAALRTSVESATIATADHRRGGRPAGVRPGPPPRAPGQRRRRAGGPAAGPAAGDERHPADLHRRSLHRPRPVLPPAAHRVGGRHRAGPGVRGRTVPDHLGPVRPSPPSTSPSRTWPPPWATGPCPDFCGSAFRSPPRASGPVCC